MPEIRIGRGRHRRAVLIATPILLVVAIAALLPAAIRAGVHSALAGLGFTESHGGSVSLGLHHLRIRDIRLGSQGHATVAATFSLGSLLHGRVQTIAVSDVELHGAIASDGSAKIDGFALPESKQTPSSPIDLPADTVTIGGVVLVLDTPAGPSRITAGGVVTSADGSLNLLGTLGIASDILTGTAAFNFRLMPAGWSLSSPAVVIAFDEKTDSTNAATGHVTLSSTPGGVTGDAALKGQDLTIGAMPIRSLSLTVKADSGSLSGGFQLVPRQGGSGIDASLKSDSSGIGAILKADFSEIGTFSKATGGTLHGPLQARLAVHADPPGDKRPVTLDLAYDGVAPGAISLRNAKLKAAGVLDARNALTLTSCGPFSADSTVIAGFSLTKLSGCLGPVPDSAAFSHNGSGGTDLAIAIGSLAVSIPSAKGALADAKIPALRVKATVADGGLGQVDASLDGGAIEFPGLGTGLRNLGIKANVAGDGALAGSIAGSLSPAAPKSPTLPVTGTLGGTRDAPTLTASAGSFIKLSLTGQKAKLEIPATELGQGGADLLGLAPGLATVASKLSGTLALSLSADWSGRALNSGGKLALTNVGATTPNFMLEGLDGTITLDSLVPLSTADSQVLTMRSLVAGVPLTNGQITFGLTRQNRLNIADAHWTLAGGRIGTYDQQLDLYGPDQNLGLVVKGVDLAELLKLANLDGLSAEGTVEGTIPLRRTKDIIRIEHGVLQTNAPGVIRYDPAETPSFLQGQPGQGTTILRDALKDFHYQQLGLTIDGLLGGEEQIKVSLNGANPTLYGGVPVKLNVNLSGALDSIARSSVEAYTNPTKTVHRKLQTKPGEKK